MDKRKIEKVQPEQVQISEQKADVNSVSPAFANALVVGSQSPVTRQPVQKERSVLMDIDKAYTIDGLLKEFEAKSKTLKMIADGQIEILISGSIDPPQSNEM